MSDQNKLFRALPSVDFLLKEAENGPAISRPMLRGLVNEFLDECRAQIKTGAYAGPEELADNALVPALNRYIADKGRPHFRRTINATGVVIHTNLGRSILVEAAADAAREACLHYSNLEFNLETGARGSRYSHVEKLLCSLTGAEAALAVNNNAAAVLLILDTFCKGREVIVARGQLVEIGGSFRIPEVMEKSGCILREVGSTNRVRIADYAAAITENTAALMKVHTSNFRVVGFHESAALADLAALGHEKGLPVIEDLGSGNFCNFAEAGVAALASLSADEPTVQKSVADGADVVSFSGDKVLGGPQAGIIVGRAEYINKIKKNPLNRALRIDKMTLAALEATLRVYTNPEEAMAKIPTLRMICAPLDELKSRARRLARRLSTALSGLAEVNVRAGESLVGGGSFPERHLPTTLVYISTAICPAQELRQRLLGTSIPLVARLEDDCLCLDVRTIDDKEFALVERVLKEALGKA